MGYALNTVGAAAGILKDSQTSCNGYSTLRGHFLPAADPAAGLQAAIYHHHRKSKKTIEFLRCAFCALFQGKFGRECKEYPDGEKFLKRYCPNSWPHLEYALKRNEVLWFVRGRNTKQEQILGRNGIGQNMGNTRGQWRPTNIRIFEYEFVNPRIL